MRKIANGVGRLWSPSSLAHTIGVIYVLFGMNDNVVAGLNVEELLQSGNKKCCVVNLIGQATLREVCSTLKDCEKVVSVETAGLHLAITLGIPTVGIVGGGHYGRFVTWGDPTRHRFLTADRLRSLRLGLIPAGCRVHSGNDSRNRRHGDKTTPEGDGVMICAKGVALWHQVSQARFSRAFMLGTSSLFVQT